MVDKLSVSNFYNVTGEDLVMSLSIEVVSLTMIDYHESVRLTLIF